MVVRSGEDGEVFGRGDGGRVFWDRVADCRRVAGDSRLLDVVAGFSTDEEALVAESSVDDSSRAAEEIEKSAGLEVWLLEVQVQLGALCLCVWQELGDRLSLETARKSVVELDLGVERVGSRPCLGKGDTYILSVFGSYIQSLKLIHTSRLVGVLGLELENPGVSHLSTLR